jgi:hypothetical protein
MSTFLWIVQGVLAVKLLSAAYNHGLGRSGPEWRQGADSIGSMDKGVSVTASILMFAGALSLVGPVVPGVPLGVVPAAGAGLAVLHVSAVVFHLRCREDPKVFAAVVLSVLAALVAVGRWAVAPL